MAKGKHSRKHHRKQRGGLAPDSAWGSVLNNYGVKFPLSIKDFSYRGAYINVKMRPIYDSNSGLLFFENDLKNLLRATNNGWVKEFVPSE